MKKILESRIVSLIITIIITTTISVFATTIISSNSVSYTNSKTNETTVEGSLNELFSAVDINKRLGNTTKISSIGDGTVSGAVSTLNSKINEFRNDYGDISASSLELKSEQNTPFVDFSVDKGTTDYDYRIYADEHDFLIANKNANNIIDLKQMLVPDFSVIGDALNVVKYDKLVNISGFILLTNQVDAEGIVVTLPYKPSTRYTGRIGGVATLINSTESIAIYMFPNYAELRPANTNMKAGYWYVNISFFTD